LVCSKWVLRYIKDTIDVGLVFEKDSMSKQECVECVNSDYARDLDKCRFTTGYVFIVDTQKRQNSRIHLQSV